MPLFPCQHLKITCQRLIDSVLGVILFDEDKFEKIYTELDKLLIDWKGTKGHCVKVNDETMAIALSGYDIIFINSEGRIVNKIDEQTKELLENNRP